jgi:hypothetical protein
LTDEANVFDNSEGFLSIVVPEYGNDGMSSVSKWAIYRCGKDGKFYRLSTDEIESFL